MTIAIAIAIAIAAALALFAQPLRAAWNRLLDRLGDSVYRGHPRDWFV